MIEDAFAIFGVVVFMTWLFIRRQSPRKFVHLFGILAGIWFIWIFSALDIVAYLNGEDIEFIIAIGAFLIGASIILISVKELIKNEK